MKKFVAGCFMLLVFTLSVFAQTEVNEFDWKDLKPLENISAEQWNCFVEKYGSSIRGVYNKSGAKQFGFWVINEPVDYSVKTFEPGHKRGIFVVRENNEFVSGICIDSGSEELSKCTFGNAYSFGAFGYDEKGKTYFVSATRNTNIVSLVDLKGEVIDRGIYEWSIHCMENDGPFYMWNKDTKKLKCIDLQKKKVTLVRENVELPYFYYGNFKAFALERETLYGLYDPATRDAVPGSSFLLTEKKAVPYTEK